MIDLESLWRRPPPDLALSRDDVHVWRVSLEQPTERVHRLTQTLSSDEMERAKRFHFERDRRRFIVGRGVLRAILSQYLGTDPSQVQFSYGPRGKPRLAAGFDGDALRFNLAHSHELALYAFTRDREIGIDLEYIHPLSDAEELAAQVFSRRENAELEAMPERKRVDAFFGYWTCKEAYIKATGDGLSLPLDQFEISLAPGKSPHLVRVEQAAEEVERWALEPLTPRAGYVAALAVEGRDYQLRFLQWEGPWD